jgi:hypothetical protein
MANPTVFEKLQYNNEKNLLIQGLPSSLEKQFIKLPFAKSLTPLLRSRRVDFALVFAVSQKQLCDILNDVISALNPDAKLWISYPKPAAKIASDLCREQHWQVMDDHNLVALEKIELDNVWRATQFSFSINNASQKSIVIQEAIETIKEKTISRRTSSRSRTKEVVC